VMRSYRKVGGRLGYHSWFNISKLKQARRS
jgi:hypothetical protein